MPVFNNAVSCISNFAQRVQFMLSALTTKTENKTKRKTEGHQETRGGVGYDYNVDWGDGITNACQCSNCTN